MQQAVHQFMMMGGLFLKWELKAHTNQVGVVAI
jgi:hypothetical protein